MFLGNRKEAAFLCGDRHVLSCPRAELDTELFCTGDRNIQAAVQLVHIPLLAVTILERVCTWADFSGQVLIPHVSEPVFLQLSNATAL